MKDTTLFEILTDLHMKEDIGMCYCGKRIETPQHSYGPATRNHYLFVLVNKGTAVLYGKNEIHFGNHDLLVMLPNERIHYKALENWNITWVGLYGETVSRLMDFFDITPENPLMHISLYNELNSVMDKIYNTSKDTSISSKLSITGLIYEFFSILMQNANITKQNENIIKAALRIIDYNYTSPITINQIAQRLSLNGSYFSSIFTKQTGISPKQYILKKRMERAKELLKETDISVSEIAYSVGYEDQFYFSRIFKKHIGIPPVEFRKSEQAEHYSDFNF